MQISDRFVVEIDEDAGVVNPSYLFEKEEHRIVTLTNRDDEFTH